MSKRQGNFERRESYPFTGLNRPLELTEVEAPRISRQSTHEGCQSYARDTFTLQEIFLVVMSVTG
jgi:hypothetical protein